MTDLIPFEQQAEAVKLRGQPKPVTRINRKVVMAGAGLGVVLLFGAAMLALDPPKFNEDQAGTELINTRNRPTAEALDSLPGSYADYRPPVTQAAPVLGPPMAGDLGATILATERELGINYQDQAQPEQVFSFAANPETDAARADRIRLAKLGQEAQESPVFFSLSGGQSQGASGQNAELASFETDPFASLVGNQPNVSTNAPSFAPERDPNLQDSKNTFASEALDSDIYNQHAIVDPASPYQVMAGTVIPASLITGLNSDLPGTIIAQVTQPVYDTATGGDVMIPQGSRLIGRYDSRVSFGQDRALVVWDRIIFPNAASILIDALPGTDQRGFAGLHDRVNNHFGRLLGAAGLATLLSIGTELSFSDDSGSIAGAIEESLQDSTNQAGQRIVDRNLNIQPTLTVRPGWPLRVIVTRDLILRPYAEGE